MIGIISTCSEKLSEEEFVNPITRIVKNYEIKNFRENYIPEDYEKIIITGTALIDNNYLEFLENFDWLKDFDRPVLGICSGMQILALKNGSSLEKTKEIGLVDIETLSKNHLFSGKFQGYALHGNSVKNLENFLIFGRSKQCVQAIKHKKKDHYGILFHPEVRNIKIIENFLHI